MPPLATVRTTMAACLRDRTDTFHRAAVQLNVETGHFRKCESRQAGLNYCPTAKAQTEGFNILRYQDPQSRMTLREALEELRHAEGDVSQDVSGELAAALEAHDVVHILFGLDISDLDEIVAHGWMACGTTLTLAEMHEITRDRDHRRFSSGFGHGKRGLLILRALPRLIGAHLRARRMTKRWPWHSHIEFLDRPLDDIRREFGIKLQPPRDSTVPRPRGPHHLPISRSA
jgi:hypothetical protein